MELSVHSPEKKANAKISVSENAFGYAFNEGLIHQVVTAYLSAARAGTKAQKTRAEVSGGGIKPWRQKGTGRARAGSSRSPIWRKGGVTFAAKPRDFSQKINRKMYTKAMASILSELNRQGRLIVVESLQLAEPKTKVLKSLLEKLEIKNTLIILNGEDKNVFLASRNLMGVDVCDAAYVDPVSLVGAEKIVLTVEAVKKLEERLA